MSLTKINPRSDDARATALTSAKTRKDSVLPADNVISAANSAALDLEEALFKTLKESVDVLEAAFHEAVGTCNDTFAKTKNRVSHGFQILNFQIDDEILGWKISDRSFYSLNLNGHLPPMGSETQIVQAANNFIIGETKRIAAGGTPMTMVTKAEVEILLALLNDNLIDRSNKKSALSDAIQLIVEHRPITDELIDNIWSDVENGGHKLEAPARREYAALWGVVYKSIKEVATLNVKAVDSVTGVIIRGVNLSIGPLKGKHTTVAITNDYGVATIETRKFEATNLIAENSNYEFYSETIELSQGEEKSIVIRMKFKAIM